MKTSFCFAFAMFWVALLSERASAQTYTWNVATTENAWLRKQNWDGGTKFPGDTNNLTVQLEGTEGTASDVAIIGRVGFSSSSIGIDFSPEGNPGNGNNASANGLLSLGAIVFSTSATGAGVAKNITIGDSSGPVQESASAILRLNGALIDGSPRVLIAVKGANDLTLAPKAGGALTMEVQLGIGDGRIVVNSGRTLTISTAITEGASGRGLTLEGGGTLNISGVGSYTGATTVSTGTLRVDGTLTSSAVTVGQGGTLAGKGTIGGAVTIQNGGTLAPGNNPGVLTLQNGLTFDAGSTFAVDLKDSAKSRIESLGYDQALVTSGNVTLDTTGNGVELRFLSTTPSGSFDSTNFFVLVNNQGSQTLGVFAGLNEGAQITELNNFGGAGNVWHIYYRADLSANSSNLNSYTGGNDIVVAMAPVPEPSTILALGFVGLGVIGAIRRALPGCRVRA